MVVRQSSAKVNISLIVACISALMSIGGVAFAAGVLNTRVEGISERAASNGQRIDRLDNLPERLARIETDVAFLRAAEERRAQRAENRNDRNEMRGEQ